KFTQLIQLLCRRNITVRRDFRHQGVAVARYALQCDAEHAMHVAIRFRGLEETNAMVVGVAYQAGKLILSKIPLHAARHGASAKSKPGHLYVRFSERHPVSCRSS